MIQRERTHTGRFGIGRFCPRRFKRLTPALAVMVGVTTILALFLLSPFGLQQRAAETGLGEVLVAANFVTVVNTGDYCAPPAETTVRLHTWTGHRDSWDAFDVAIDALPGRKVAGKVALTVS